MGINKRTAFATTTTTTTTTKKPSSFSLITSSTPRGGSTTKLSAGGVPGALPLLLFDNGPLWLGSGILVAANALGCCINLVAPTFHYHVDLLGTGAFAAAALPTLLLLSSSNAAAAGVVQKWSAAAVVLWSTKLAAFLFYRVLSNGKDGRFDALFATPASTAGFWTVSAAWGLLCSLPHALGSTAVVVASTAGPVLVSRAGLLLFGVGFVTETVADYQKWAFKRAFPGEFCHTGLWSVSQHPNWFGNLLLWSGIFLMNAPLLIGTTTAFKKSSVYKKVWSCRRLALAAIGPLFMWTLFDAQATGKIMADALLATKGRYGYGSDPAFTSYLDNTPLIVPNLFASWFRPKA